jgi:hypothetical protein
MRMVIGILRVGNMRYVPELISIVGSFKKHWVSNLPLLVTAIALQAFPHD